MKEKQRTIAQTCMKYGTYLLFLLVVVIMLFASGKFRTLTNAVNILLQNSTIGVLAVGMTLVIITGGIDLSVGAIMTCSACVMAVLVTEHGASQWTGIGVCLLISLLFGALNGFAVAFIRMPAFLVTLSTQAIGQGVALVVSRGNTYRKFSPFIAKLGTASFMGLPVLVWVMLLCMGIGYLILHCSVYGRKVLAIGGNAEAARVSGINTRIVEMLTYTITGLFSGVAAIMTVARIGSYWTAMGNGIEFDAISGIVIGGTSLAGGSGTIPGTFIGVLLMGVIANALNLLGVDAYWQSVAKGIVIFVAVMIDAFRSRLMQAE